MWESHLRNNTNIQNVAFVSQPTHNNVKHFSFILKFKQFSQNSENNLQGATNKEETISSIKEVQNKEHSFEEMHLSLDELDNNNAVVE